MGLKTARSADISLDRVYRYHLQRFWAWDRSAFSRSCCWIMLNPSTADASVDDPTIRRCINFSHGWGFGRMTVVNLFAFRAANPKMLRTVRDPVGSENDDWILGAVRDANTVVCAWGRGGSYLDRDKVVLDLIRAIRPKKQTMCLGTNADGTPRHPLYLPRATVLEPYNFPWC